MILFEQLKEYIQIHCRTKVFKNVVFENDGWTVRTKDRKPSAHFEHCIAIRPDGPDILSSFKFIEEVLGDNAI